MKVKSDLIEKDFDDSVKPESSKSYEFLPYLGSAILFDKEP